jgi:hypothetical protein
MLSSESANVFIKKFRDCFLWFGLVICVNAVLGLFHTFAMCLYFLNFSWPLVVAWPFYCSFLYFLGLLCEINFYIFFLFKGSMYGCWRPRCICDINNDICLPSSYSQWVMVASMFVTISFIQCCCASLSFHFCNMQERTRTSKDSFLLLFFLLKLTNLDLKRASNAIEQSIHLYLSVPIMNKLDPYIIW